MIFITPSMFYDDHNPSHVHFDDGVEGEVSFSEYLSKGAIFRFLDSMIKFFREKCSILPSLRVQRSGDPCPAFAGMTEKLDHRVIEALTSTDKQVLVTTPRPMILKYLNDEVAKSGVIYLYKTPRLSRSVRNINERKEEKWESQFIIAEDSTVQTAYRFFVKS